MRLQLERRWTEKLARLPEAGMGYQRVHVRLKAGRTVEHALVYNASILEVPDEIAPFAPEDIAEIELAVSPGR
jgi:hypothetical protein